MIVTQPKEMIAAFVSQAVGAHLPWGNYNAIGWVRDGELRWGVVYNHRSECNVAMHVAGVGPIPRLFLFAAFDYPFNELGLSRVTGLVPKKNKKARIFDEHVGFKLEGCMRHALPHDDLLVYGMLKRECVWIQPKFTDRLLGRRALPLAA